MIKHFYDENNNHKIIEYDKVSADGLIVIEKTDEHGIEMIAVINQEMFCDDLHNVEMFRRKL